MLKIDDLKHRRNEWVKSDLSYVLLDANDGLHKLERVYTPNGERAGWALAWVFIDNPWGVPQIAPSLFQSAEAAMAWADAYFVEHFEWFDVAEAA